MTDSLAEYAFLALDLAGDPARRDALRRRLDSGRATSPLFDADGLAGAVEAAYVRMWDGWRQGRAPESFAVG